MVQELWSARRPWQYYFEKGRIEFRAEMYDFALENLERTLELNPEQYQAANIMAEIFLLKDKKEEALEYFNKSLAINIKQPDILCSAGSLEEFFLQYSKAFDKYLKAVEADPSHIKGHLNLIRMYARRGDMKNALKHFNICNMLGKAEGDKYYAIAYNAERRDLDEAIKLYNTAIKKNPAMTEAYYRLSHIYRMKNEHDTAILYLKRVAEIRPDMDRAFIQLGHLYMRKGLTGKPLKSRHTWKRKNTFRIALKYFNEAIRLNPENGDLYSYVADIYGYMGDDDSAEKAREKAFAFEKEASK